MLQMLMDGIRGMRRFFSDERRRESDRGKPSRRGATYRAALSAVCKLLFAAVMLNPFAASAQTIDASAFIGTWQSQSNDDNGAIWNHTATVNGDFTWSAFSSTPATATRPAGSCTVNGTYVVSAVDVTTVVTSWTAIGAQCDPVSHTILFSAFAGSGGVGSTLVDDRGITWTKTAAPAPSTTVDMTGTWTASMSGTIFSGESGEGQTTWFTFTGSSSYSL